MWFDAGVVFGCIAMVMSMLLLSVTIVNMLSRQPTEQQILVPVVSGLTVTDTCVYLSEKDIIQYITRNVAIAKNIQKIMHVFSTKYFNRSGF